MRNRILYVALMAVSSIIGLVKMLVFSNLLPVAEFGVYSLILVASIYLIFVFNLGLEPGFLRNGAMLWGTGNKERLGLIYRQVITLTILIGFMATFANYILVERFVEPKFGTFKYLSIFSISILLFNLTTCYLRVCGHLVSFSFCFALKQILVIPLVLLLFDDFGLLSIIYAEVGVTLLVVCIILYATSFNFCWPNILVLAPLFKVGFPFTFNYFIRTLVISVDRWVVTIALGVVSFGYYSFAMIAFTSIQAVANIIIQATVPKWIAEYGATKDISLFQNNIKKTQVRIVIFALPIALITMLSLDFIMASFFDKYALAIDAMRVIIIASLFHIINFYEHLFIALEKGYRLIRITLINSVIVSSFLFAGWYFQQSIFYYACVFLLGRVMVLMLTYTFSKQIIVEHNQGLHHAK